MKKLIKTLLFLFFIFHSCTDNRLEGIYDDTVYFVKSGKNEVNGFVSEEEMVLEVPIYRSGIGDENTDIEVGFDESILLNYSNSEGAKYRALPMDCYKVVDPKFELKDNNRLKVVRILINIKKINNLQGVLDENYAIPLVLNVDKRRALNGKDELLVVPILTGGIDPSKTEVLWSKTLTELGVANTDHFTASLAVSDKYVFLNTRNADLRYYDRFNGEFKGSISLPFKGSLSNFTIANDNSNNLLITNLRNAVGIARQTIYKINDLGAPILFIDVDHEYPNGRKLSIAGDLNRDAIITSAVENSSRIIYWEVRDGVLLDQVPKMLILDPSKINWRTFADAIPKGVSIDEGLFVIGTGTITGFGYFGVDGQLLGSINLSLLGFPTENTNTFQSLADVTFNGARYLAFANQSGPSQTYSGLLDVTKTSFITPQNTSNLLKFKSDPLSTIVNANATADVQVRLSNDMKSFMLYTLGTNGGCVAIKFTN